MFRLAKSIGFEMKEFVDSVVTVGPWQVLLAESGEIQIDGPSGFIVFNLTSPEKLTELAKFWQHKVASLVVGTMGDLEVSLFWDEEFPETRAFVKFYNNKGKKDVLDGLVFITLEGDTLKQLEECVNKLLEEC